MTQKAILQIGSKVATHTSDGKKIKVTDTSNGNLQQKLLNNRTLPIIATLFDPCIDDRVATSRALTIKLVTPRTKEVITYLVRSNARTLWTPGHVSRTGRDSSTPGNCNIYVRSPRVNSPVLIGGTNVSPTRTGIQDIVSPKEPRTFL